MSEIIFKTKTASEEDIFSHLQACKDNFMPPLDRKVDIGEYAKKISEKAVTFEAWSGSVLAGLVAVYFNDQESKIGYITNVSSMKEYMGRGIAKKLTGDCIEYAKANGFKEIRLEVSKESVSAIGLYKKFGFINYEEKDDALFMKLEVQMLNERPLLSIVSAVYNHEKFIARAIDGFLMQKTDFPFEIVIGEDCSTDRTREICLEYQKKNPDKIRLLLREKNLGAMENHLGVIESCSSRYLANCEGDDYWTDPLKLQKQVDFLENNPDYAIACHNVEVKEEASGKVVREWFGKDKKQDLTIEDIISKGGGATCSLVWRNKVFGDFPDWFREQKGGDWSLQILCASKGKMRYFRETMGVYRLHSGAAMSARIKEAFQKNIDITTYHYNNMQNLVDSLDKHFSGKYSELFGISTRANTWDAFSGYFYYGDYENSKKLAAKLLPDSLKFPLPIILKMMIKFSIIYLLPQKSAETILQYNRKRHAK